MNFLIESENYLPKHDFGFAVIEACKYRKDFNYTLSEDYYRHPSVYTRRNRLKVSQVPVGSVDFVHRHLLNWYGQSYVPTPCIIAQELNQFLGREYKVLAVEELPLVGEYFIKPANLVKGETTILNRYTQAYELTEKEYICSSLINISSEHRVFVHNNRVVDIRTYNNDFLTLPDLDKLNRIIRTIANPPIAYTLDVAVTEEKETVIIELHNFYSCSLYGMQDTEKAAIMMSQWFCEHLRKLK